jgi:hypothetical protein
MGITVPLPVLASPPLDVVVAGAGAAVLLLASVDASTPELPDVVGVEVVGAVVVGVEVVGAVVVGVAVVGGPEVVGVEVLSDGDGLAEVLSEIEPVGVGVGVPEWQLPVTLIVTGTEPAPVAKVRVSGPGVTPLLSRAGIEVVPLTFGWVVT